MGDGRSRFDPAGGVKQTGAFRSYAALETIALAALGNLDILLPDKQHFGDTVMQINQTGRGTAVRQTAEPAVHAVPDDGAVATGPLGCHAWAKG